MREGALEQPLVGDAVVDVSGGAAASSAIVLSSPMRSRSSKGPLRSSRSFRWAASCLLALSSNCCADADAGLRSSMTAEPPVVYSASGSSPVATQSLELPPVASRLLLIRRHPRARTQHLSCYCSRVSLLAPFVSGTAAAGSPSSWPGARPFLSVWPGPFSSSLIPGSRCRAVAKRYASVNCSFDGVPQWRRDTHTEAICGPAAQKGKQGDDQSDDENRAGREADEVDAGRRSIGRSRASKLSARPTGR